ncbi:hypothetical protein AMECASPLE_012755 [Ameca splendens]|uniref:Uncharacterized protein n=1 Tax=Ameca splendens TaxID=208324 RepID=A0ABV0Y128_9TELE
MANIIKQELSGWFSVRYLCFQKVNLKMSQMWVEGQLCASPTPDCFPPDILPHTTGHDFICLTQTTAECLINKISLQWAASCLESEESNNLHQTPIQYSFF